MTCGINESELIFEPLFAAHKAYSIFSRTWPKCENWKTSIPILILSWLPSVIIGKFSRRPRASWITLLFLLLARVLLPLFRTGCQILKLPKLWPVWSDQLCSAFLKLPNKQLKASFQPKLLVNHTCLATSRKGGNNTPKVFATGAKILATSSALLFHSENFATSRTGGNKTRATQCTQRE